MPRSPWDMIDDAKYRDEAETIADLLAHQPLSTADRVAVVGEAAALVESARHAAKKQGVVESFLQEFSLGTREGLALMCLAEALLRTPDEETRDRLIAEKIGSADWAEPCRPVRQPVRQRLDLGPDADRQAGRRRRARRAAICGGFIKRLAGRLGEPVIRQAVGAAVRIMGEQFVLGRTIEAALGAREARGLPLLVRHAGRGRAHRRRRRALRDALCRRDRGGRQGRQRRRARSAATASR